jgi:hypothetical protein
VAEPAPWPPIPVAPAAPKVRLSRLVWVFAGLILVQLAGATVAAVVYLDDKHVAQTAIARQDKQITDLQASNKMLADIADSQAKNVATAKAALATLQEQGKPLAGCEAAVQALIDAATKNDVDAQQPLLTAMAKACGAS